VTKNKVFWLGVCFKKKKNGKRGGLFDIEDACNRGKGGENKESPALRKSQISSKNTTGHRKGKSHKKGGSNQKKGKKKKQKKKPVAGRVWW